MLNRAIPSLSSDISKPPCENHQCAKKYQSIETERRTQYMDSRNVSRRAKECPEVSSRDSTEGYPSYKCYLEETHDPSAQDRPAFGGVRNVTESRGDRASS